MWTPRRRVILPVGGSVGATLCIGDLGDVSKHLEKSGIISPPGDTLTDGEESDTAGRWELVLPPTEYGYGRGGIGGGGYIF